MEGDDTAAEVRDVGNINLIPKQKQIITLKLLHSVYRLALLVFLTNFHNKCLLTELSPSFLLLCLLELGQ